MHFSNVVSESYGVCYSVSTRGLIFSGTDKQIFDKFRVWKEVNIHISVWKFFLIRNTHCTLICTINAEPTLYRVRLKGFYVVVRFSAYFSENCSEAVSGRLWGSRGKFKTMQAF